MDIIDRMIRGDGLHGPLERGGDDSSSTGPSLSKNQTGTYDESRELMRPIHGFVHVALVPGWQPLFEELLDLIKSTGLYGRTDVIWVGLLGPDPNQFNYCDPKIRLIYFGNDLSQFEFPTLEVIRRCCRILPCYVYYLHLKGLFSERVHPSVGAWRRYMEYFIVERHMDCITALQDFDVCGVDWEEQPWPHFAGNFWWARSEYVSGLPAITEMELADRHNAERWIGMKRQTRVMCLHQSHVNHYWTYYAREAYAK